MVARRQPYVILLRGINVGGKNKVPMAELRSFLEGLGFSSVSTYIASGNVILESERRPEEIRAQIEKALPKSFALDRDLVKVLVLSHAQLKAVVDGKPKGFGEKPKRFHSDAIFLIDLDAEATMPLFSPREGVDTLWPGKDVIYSQRLSAQRTKSRLNKIVSSPAYQSMSIRNWNTTTALLQMIEARRVTKADRHAPLADAKRRPRRT